MAKGKRKRLLIGVAGFVGLLIAALLAAPLFIDVAAYKPEIVAQVKRATGRDVVIEGPIRLSLLPTPAVALDGVKFFNLPGSKNPDMVEVKSVVVKPVLLALLWGEVEPGEVTLVEPKIVLEINAQGKPNWEFTPSVAEAVPAAAKPASPKPLSLGRLTVRNGTLIFSDSRAGLSVSAGKANFSASVGSIDGPYALAGGAVVNDAPLRIDLAVGAKTAAGHAVDVALEAGGGKLAFKGTLSELGPAARLSGRASAASDNLVAFAESLIRMAGQPPPRLPPLLAGKFSFDGPVELSPTAAAARDFKLTLGQDSGAGSFVLSLVPALSVDASFSASRLDLDRWLAALAVARQCGDPAGAGTCHPGRRSGRRTGGARTAGRRCGLAGEPQREAGVRGRRGDLQHAARARRGAAARGARRRRRRAEIHRHPAGRPRRAGQLHPVGRSGAPHRVRRLQPGRAAPARDPGVARSRRLGDPGRQAHPARHEWPHGVDGRQRAGDRCHGRARRSQGRRRHRRGLRRAAVGHHARRAGHARSRLLPAGRPASSLGLARRLGHADPRPARSVDRAQAQDRPHRAPRRGDHRRRARHRARRRHLAAERGQGGRPGGRAHRRARRGRQLLDGQAARRLRLRPRRARHGSRAGAGRRRAGWPRRAPPARRHRRQLGEPGAARRGTRRHGMERAGERHARFARRGRGHDQVGLVQGPHRRQRPADRGRDRLRPLGPQAGHRRRPEHRQARFRPAGRGGRRRPAAPAARPRRPRGRSRSARRCARSTARSGSRWPASAAARCRSATPRSPPP